jgi:hypothetical protein
MKEVFDAVLRSVEEERRHGRILVVLAEELQWG